MPKVLYIMLGLVSVMGFGSSRAAGEVCGPEAAQAMERTEMTVAKEAMQPDGFDCLSKNLRGLSVVLLLDGVNALCK